MFSISVSKEVTNIEKFNRELHLNNSKFSYFNKKGSDIEIFYSSQLTQVEIDSLFAFINSFVEVDLTDLIQSSLLKSIDPWIDSFLRRVRAENIEMGITQLGKTLPVQALFEKQFELSTGMFVSMMGIMSTGSITLLIPLFDYLIANPSYYSGLEPFISESRLNEWKSEVIGVLS